MKRLNAILVTLLLTLTMIISTGCGKSAGGSNLSIPGINGPKLTLLGDSILISMVFQNLVLDGGARISPVPQYPNSFIELGPDLQSSGTLMTFNISLKDVFGIDTRTLDPQQLPGGRALPGVASGRLPAVAFTIPQFKNISVYLGPALFGIFVPLKKLNIQGSIITARYYVSGRRSGNLSLVGQDSNGQNAGVLLLLDMKSSTKKRLKKFAKI